MAQGIYVASAEAQTDKAIVVLGMMELLWHQTQKVGFFRPIIKDEQDRDPMIHLVKSRYNLKLSYDEMYGFTHDIARDMIAADRYDEFQKLIIEKYKNLKRNAMSCWLRAPISPASRRRLSSILTLTLPII